MVSVIFSLGIMTVILEVSNCNPSHVMTRVVGVGGGGWGELVHSLLKAELLEGREHEVQVPIRCSLASGHTTNIINVS